MLGGCATASSEGGGERPDRRAKRELADIATFRETGHSEAAVAGLNRLLKWLSEEGGTDALSAKTRAALDTELRATRVFTKEIGAKELAAAHPLAAEAELARLSPLLTAPELASARQEAAARIRAGGEQTCARLRAASQTPNWAIVVARYCAHFGDAGGPVVPSGAAPLTVSGAIKGLSGAQAELVRSRVAEWFRASLWTKAADTAVGRAGVTGTFEATFQHASVTLHAPYEAAVTTHTTDDRWQPAESFANTLRSVGLPASGDKTTTGTVTSVYAYDAEESRGSFHLDARVTFELDAGGPTVFDLRQAATVKTYDHDVTFEPAGIAPRHDAPPSADDWLLRELDRVGPAALKTLDRRFLSTFCARPAFELEDAARCLVVRPHKAALAAIAGTIGEDAERLAAVLGPPPPPRPLKQAAATPPRPRRGPAASSGATDDEEPAGE